MDVNNKSCYFSLSVLENDWFKEINDGWPGYSINIQVEEILFNGKSDYQDILVFKSKRFGNVLVLNGIIQCIEWDEFAYQEMITHLPMALHPNPQKVLVIGGGDGGVVRELLKYDCVRKVILCEIDQVVLDLCKKHLPSMSSCLDDPRVTINIGDGVEFIKKHPEEFDVIITDSPDPEADAEALFNKSYYTDLKGALKQDGIACSQGLTPYTDLPFIKNLVAQCKDIFPKVGYATGNTPLYAMGTLGYLLFSRIPDIDFTKPLRKFSNSDLERMKLKYYNSDIHAASFVLPNCFRNELQDFLDT
ncbi:spermidine synthase-like isoform X2 [Biomphalaria pfeifferi]|uniref:Spermidine synthase-like isoform X2 n=1 Tax=Biomphalaria pfeifferi TaxID=112525 RepID=A0AAD8BVE5_BIOPF|nr:spermidine synthase-like isoform X2 [Biomphalaria pfeifferi]